MQEHDGRPSSLLAHEARRAPGRKPPAGRAMDVDRVAGVLAAHRSDLPFRIGAILSPRAAVVVPGDGC